MPTASYRAIWALLVYAWVSNYLVRMALGPLLPPIMDELGLAYARAGFLSAAFFLGYMAMQFPAGFLGDRFGRTRMLVAGLVLSAAASTLTGLVGSFAALVAVRVLTGLGQGFLFSNDRVVIAATTPREKMALGQGVSFSGPGIGTTLGLLLAGALGRVWPWRGVFFAFAVPPLVAAALLWRMVPEPARVTAAGGAAWPFRRVLASRDFWLLGASGSVPVYIQFLLATWGPLLFAEIGVRDLGHSAALASLQGLVAPPGLLLSGWLADRAHRRGGQRKVIIAGAAILAAVAMAGMGATVAGRGAPWLLAALMLVASFAVWCTWGPAYALLGGLLPPSVLGKAFGLYNCTCFVGAVAGPYLTGWLKDATGTFAAGLYAAAALSALCLLPVLALEPPFRLGGRGSLEGREPS
jgi:MFS family permease